VMPEPETGEPKEAERKRRPKGREIRATTRPDGSVVAEQ
jgi:hypothetical protein